MDVIDRISLVFDFGHEYPFLPVFVWCHGQVFGMVFFS